MADPPPVSPPRLPPPPPPDVQLLDLRTATTYQDSSSFDKQAPVNDLSFADSTTGRPWAECGHYTSQWWGVDLGSEAYVRYVRLQNRNDCCAERLTDVDIYLGSTAETYTGNALVKSDVSVSSNVMLEVEINALGRYIYLNRPSAAGLTVCKFYVFASAAPPGPPSPPPPSPPPPAPPPPPPCSELDGRTQVPQGGACKKLIDLGNCSSYYAGPFDGGTPNYPEDDTWRLCRPPSNLSKEVCDGDKLLDLRTATTYQDSSSFDKQAPVNDLSYADSTTGRPWAECGHYTSQWWGVDLGSEAYVRYVRLQNRNDCCAERLTDVDIYLGSTAETYTGNALVKSDVSVSSNVMLEVEINALGRYIYLNRPSAAGLTVCKFYVFASAAPPGPPSPPPPSPPPPAPPPPPPCSELDGRTQVPQGGACKKL
ncbi:hypothetical protein EMIHUDRAFT_470312, partial [Emiliania huxleyi CCMP1516]|uniref:F5/8 type C domain-containing protein n=2 Tax=Emiliania huxleyi TaxID=2903 RepID=A0A0D3J125_EMIH1